MSDTTFDALIMAAGRGSRLGAATADVPKGLVDLGGVSALELQIDILVSRGVRRLVVVTGYRRHMVEAAVQSRLAGGASVEFVWNPFWPITNVLGSVWMARHLLEGRFAYLHADTVFEPAIFDDLLAAREEAALAVDVRECEPEQMKAEVVDGVITHLSKDLPDDRTTGEFIGVGVFSGASAQVLRRAIDATIEEGGFHEYFEAALNRAIAVDGLAIAAVPTRGRAWTEIDFPEDLELARRSLPAFRLPG